MNDLPYRLLGEPTLGGLLIVGDHASNHVPSGIDLGIDPVHLRKHIAWDIGVAEVASIIVRLTGCTAYLGNFSRLVVDLNRHAEEPDAVPMASDGVNIFGNHLDTEDRRQRLADYHHPYHHNLSLILAEYRPNLILSLHSFTAQLETAAGEQRPWEIGVLYNEHETASKFAVAYLHEHGIKVGDQLPYSGKLLNATMNTHAESNNIPYIGIEMRQDMVSDVNGQERFAQILADMCHFVSEKLGLRPQNQ